MIKLHLFSFKAMGSPCELRFYHSCETQSKKIADKLIAEVHRLEFKYTRYRDDSITAEINKRAGSGHLLSVDEETATLLDYAGVAHQQSDGLFDITSGILRRAWNFKVNQLPEQSLIDSLLPLIGWEKVDWSEGHIHLPLEGMEIDFGGYVKEYAADAAIKILTESGVDHGLVDLGGDIAVLGPQLDGRPWSIGVRNAYRPEQAMATIELDEGGLASSGNYERFIDVEGKRYCHILNPFTGWPVDSLASVSVLAPHCLIAGTVTTIAMLKGQQGGVEWLESVGLPFLLLDQQGEFAGSIAGV